MIDTLYIENDVAGHPRTRAIAARFAAATRVRCERYGEVFNPRAQSFRLQKRKPALILARKFDRLVLDAPAGYGIGGVHNYYFSHMMNCLYDCRYCFLQGMYRSAHYVVFVNFEDFAAAMDARLAQHPGEAVWFFSGYDCDSLAFEPATGFLDHFLPFFARRPRARLEIRTKSTQIRRLLDAPPLANVVVAFSLTPRESARALEHRVPSLQRRLEAMGQLARRGWRLGLRFDPLIDAADFEPRYRRLFREVFAAVDARALHSVTLGAFRMPRDFFRNVVRMFPDEPLFAGPLADDGAGLVGYGAERERQMLEFCLHELLRYVSVERVFSCDAGARPAIAGAGSCVAACG